MYHLDRCKHKKVHFDLIDNKYQLYKDLINNLNLLFELHNEYLLIIWKKKLSSMFWLPSQFSPVYPSKHWHWYPDLLDKQRPFVVHGFDEQKSISVEKNVTLIFDVFYKKLKKQTSFTPWTRITRRTFKKNKIYSLFSS